jgi:hypothetical protein
MTPHVPFKNFEKNHLLTNKHQRKVPLLIFSKPHEPQSQPRIFQNKLRLLSPSFK